MGQRVEIVLSRTDSFAPYIIGADTIAFLRDSDTEQILVIGNRGPGDRPATALFVRDGGIPDGMEFSEIFSGQTLAVQNGYLPLPIVP